jgi:peptide/nickel transport system ATP-binding protein
MLEIKNLSLSISGTPILRDVNLSVGAGKILGIVGESGSGKSLTALSTMQLMPDGSELGGEILYKDQNLLQADEGDMMQVRGQEISMIFQEPMTALNPVHTIGAQVCEAIRNATTLSQNQLETQAAAMLEKVGLPVSRFPLSRFPHQLSGGQRQRVMIAMACAQQPSLMIADEPTTALDVTLQAQILNLLRGIVDETGMSLILISHDLAVVAEVTDDIVVMRNGEVLDAGPTGDVLRKLQHPYTAQLAKASTHVPQRNSAPILSVEQHANNIQPILKAHNIVRDYPTARTSIFKKGTPFRALNSVSFELFKGQSMGLVGESGCGKSTLARIVLGLDKATSGRVDFLGTDLSKVEGDEMRSARRNMQVVFQDPFASFNPRHRVERLVSEPLYLEPQLSKVQRRDRVRAALSEVGMNDTALEKYPHEFSGGQRQRLAIARALITRPALIVADEPVSALDVSIRAQVLDLLADLRERLNLTYLFISHDLGVVRAICDEVMVMQAGEIVEHGPVGDIFTSPASQAAQELVDATPNLERALANRVD